MNRLLKPNFIGTGLLLLVAALSFWSWYLNRELNQTLGQLSTNQVSHQSVQNLTSTSPLPETPAANPTPIPTPSPLPQSQLLANGTHTFQSFNNCGPASLSMTLSYYDINRSQAEIGNRLRPTQNPQGINDDKSVTLAEMAAYAQEELQLYTFTSPLGDVQLIQDLLAEDIPVVTRTLLEMESDIGHYRIIVGYDQDRQVLIQDDSLQGNDLEYSYQEFEQLWQPFLYEFMVVVPEDKQEIAQEILTDYQNQDAVWREALELAQNWTRSNSASGYDYLNLSVAATNLGEYQAASHAYQQGETLLPRRALWYQIEPLIAEYQLGNYQRVIQLTQTITQGNQAYSEAWALRGLAYRQLGDNQAANQALAQAESYNDSPYWPINLLELSDEI